MISPMEGEYADGVAAKGGTYDDGGLGTTFGGVGGIVRRGDASGAGKEPVPSKAETC